MRKTIFTITFRDGSTLEQSGYPLIFICGTVAHKLVLHKTGSGDWKVSDPKSGAAVLPRMTGLYKGVPCSTNGFTVSQARNLAMAELECLISRIGSARFNAALENPKPF